jgi:hypothetical protein
LQEGAIARIAFDAIDLKPSGRCYPKKWLRVMKQPPFLNGRRTSRKKDKPVLELLSKVAMGRVDQIIALDDGTKAFCAARAFADFKEV